MKILSAINAADSLSPNHFTLDEKLMWCNEVTTAIRRGVKKSYKTLDTVITSAEDICIPEDLSLIHI